MNNSKYWEDLNRYPPMTKAEESKVMVKAKEGHKPSYDLVINSNLRFVVKVAKEYKGQGLELEDLIAYGNVGLCKAFPRFDPAKGNKFFSYAVWWIRQSILQALAEDNHMIKIPHYQRVTQNLINKTKEELTRDNQREVSIHEVEQALSKQVSATAVAACRVIELDKSYAGSNDAGSALKHILKDESAIDPELVIDTESFLKELNSILSLFKDREREIVKFYFGIGETRSMTLEEIGSEFGITRERVRQIKEKLLIKLRHPTRSNKLKPYLSLLKSEILNDIHNTNNISS